MGPEVASGQVELDLWDFGDSASAATVQVLAPTNDPTDIGCAGGATYAPVTFEWRLTSATETGPWTTGVSFPSAGHADTDGKTVQIRFDLPPTWNPPPCNRWFKLSYAAAGGAFDRSTWSVHVTVP